MDLPSRPIPLIALDPAVVPLYRIHQTRFSPLYFNRPSRSGTRQRFDSSNDDYGVLYASPSFEVCMAETVIRDRFQFDGPLLIDAWEIEERSISRLAEARAGSLRLANLSAPLFAVGGSTEISSTADYAASNLSSQALHDHPGHFDGLYFASRFSNRPAIALFDDRVDPHAISTIRLQDDPRLGPFLDEFCIGIV